MSKRVRRPRAQGNHQKNKGTTVEQSNQANQGTREQSNEPSTKAAVLARKAVVTAVVVISGRKVVSGAFRAVVRCTLSCRGRRTVVRRGRRGSWWCLVFAPGGRKRMWQPTANSERRNSEEGNTTTPRHQNLYKTQTQKLHHHIAVRLVQHPVPSTTRCVNDKRVTAAKCDIRRNLESG